MKNDDQTRRRTQEEVEATLALKQEEIAILKSQLDAQRETIASLQIEKRRLLKETRPTAEDDELLEELFSQLAVSEERCQRRATQKKRWKKKARFYRLIVDSLCGYLPPPQKEPEEDAPSGTATTPSSPESLGTKEVKKKRRRIPNIVSKTFSRSSSIREK
uniref:Cytohesin-1 n=1 Tax=Steinernema glaseri TaxID=37863 RepID=A0A1I8A3H6_9BILA